MQPDEPPPPPGGPMPAPHTFRPTEPAPTACPPPSGAHLAGPDSVLDTRIARAVVPRRPSDPASLFNPFGADAAASLLFPHACNPTPTSTTHRTSDTTSSSGIASRPSDALSFPHSSHRSSDASQHLTLGPHAAHRSSDALSFQSSTRATPDALLYNHSSNRTTSDAVPITLPAAPRGVRTSLTHPSLAAPVSPSFAGRTRTSDHSPRHPAAASSPRALSRTSDLSPRHPAAATGSIHTPSRTSDHSPHRSTVSGVRAPSRTSDLSQHKPATAVAAGGTPRALSRTSDLSPHRFTISSVATTRTSETSSSSRLRASRSSLPVHSPSAKVPESGSARAIRPLAVFAESPPHGGRHGPPSEGGSARGRPLVAFAESPPPLGGQALHHQDPPPPPGRRTSRRTVLLDETSVVLDAMTSPELCNLPPPSFSTRWPRQRPPAPAPAPTMDRVLSLPVSLAQLAASSPGTYLSADPDPDPDSDPASLLTRSSSSVRPVQLPAWRQRLPPATRLASSVGRATALINLLALGRRSPEVRDAMRAVPAPAPALGQRRRESSPLHERRDVSVRSAGERRQASGGVQLEELAMELDASRAENRRLKAEQREFQEELAHLRQQLQHTQRQLAQQPAQQQQQHRQRSPPRDRPTDPQQQPHSPSAWSRIKLVISSLCSPSPAPPAPSPASSRALPSNEPSRT